MAAPDADLGDVHRMRERYSPWTGRAWLDVRAATGRTRIRIGPGYAAIRQGLREAWPDRPFDADWADGRFAPAPFGGPVGPIVVGGLVAVCAVVAVAVAAGSTVAAVGVAVLGGWGVARWLDGVEVTSAGIRVGPPWALRVPWHAVRAVGWVRVGRAVEVWVATVGGVAATGTVPPVLLPAVRARIHRLSGLALVEGPGDALDLRYARWQPAAAGVPWGVGVGVLAVAPLTAHPFAVIAGGGVVTLGLALLGAVVHARATGWGTGAIGWSTLLYALVLALVSAVTWTSP